MNPFLTLREIQAAYRRYVGTFERFSNPAIESWIERRIAEGNILWREPFLQLGRRYQRGAPFEQLIADPAIALHPETPRCFTTHAGNREASLIALHQHQSAAVRAILGERANTIIATGTGSGKSFTFGIPIVSTCLRERERNQPGIKAVIVYPMNALANSQYDEFARRLAGSGLRIALYTGDTESEEDGALASYTAATGRAQPFDSEVLSREAIKRHPPDILMTNYQMLELILTRFEDRVLFPPEHAGTLQYLVLDEVHTYTGKRGADVACLIRRLKQHTGTIGRLRCIGTSATVQSGVGEDARTLIAGFASDLFGEPFEPEHVLGEDYIQPEDMSNGTLPPTIGVTDALLDAFDGDPEHLMERAASLAEALLGRRLLPAERTREGLGIALRDQATLYFLDHDLGREPISIEEATARYRAAYRPGHAHDACRRELLAALLVGQVAEVPMGDGLASRLVPKLHAFFSQARTLHSCLTAAGPHLNDRGDRTCPACARASEERLTFPLLFCRGCGQEYYGVALQSDGTLRPRDLDDYDVDGQALYLYPGTLNQEALNVPAAWLTPRGRIKGIYRESVPSQRDYCPEHNQLDAACGCASVLPVVVVPQPLLLCPACGITYDRRPREFNKLFSFGTVGRSTATDVLVGETLRALPAEERKIIAFSDNRQDTALQAAHLNNLERRIHFRRGFATALQEAGCAVTRAGELYRDEGETMELEEAGKRIFIALRDHDALPEYARAAGKYSSSRGSESAYQRYLRYGVLQEIMGGRQRNQLNLEEAGLLAVTYDGLARFATDEPVWRGIPALSDVGPDQRLDYLHGFLDILRRSRAIAHPDLLHAEGFEQDVIGKLNETALLYSGGYGSGSIVGFSDHATDGHDARVLRWSSPGGALTSWTCRVLGVEKGEAEQIIHQVAEVMRDPEVGFLVEEQRPHVGALTMINAERLRFQLDRAQFHLTCPKCGLVHHFRAVTLCTGRGCADLRKQDFAENYFSREYLRPLDGDVRIEAEEHSGQVSGQERRKIEERFRDPRAALNTLVCTPTLELGIDIGQLTSVYLRNVPPSPSNYAQRAGRAGRKGQSSLITVFCGAGAARGPHDQYFYQHPEKIIAGTIAAPRFLLDNPALLRTHIHSLVLEVLGRDHRLPTRAREVLDLERPDQLPLFADLAASYRDALQQRHTEIELAVRAAFARERERFSWFTDEFITHTVTGFVDELERVFDAWRDEYRALQAEYDDISSLLRDQGKSLELQKRQHVVIERLDDMRNGKRDFYVYRYLGAQGFLPNYAFPRTATTVSFYEIDDDISRGRPLALREYAPGNSIYYRGNRYEVTMARLRTAQGSPAFEELLICPACAAAYLGAEAKRSACTACGTPLTTTHPYTHALAMPDMLAKRRTRITADEEERTRLGYALQPHYQPGEGIQRTTISIPPTDGESDTPWAPITMAYEHNGRILLVNSGTIQSKRHDQEMGFVLCQRCNRWLQGEDAIADHLDPGSSRACRHGAERGDLAHQVVLYSDARVDVLALDVELPRDLPPDRAEGFYMTLMTALLHATVITLNLDEQELNGFLAPDPTDPMRRRIILYETTEGGTGALASLTNAARLRQIAARACEVLHLPEDEGAAQLNDPTSGGCKSACYDCLCSFYNQLNHALLDRHLALPLLRALRQAEPSPLSPAPGPAGSGTAASDLATLLAACQTDLERVVLRAIVDRGLPLPSAVQYLCHDTRGTPIASADFYYADRHLAVLVDGPSHDQDYVRAGDADRRLRLKALGISVLPIRYDALDTGLTQLAEKLMHPGAPGFSTPVPPHMTSAGTSPAPPAQPATGWATVLAEADPRVQPLLRRLADLRMPEPEVGSDLLAHGRVVATVELCWPAQKVAGALVDELSDAAQQQLEHAGWRILLIDPQRLESAAEHIQRALALAPMPAQREGMQH